jgi:hypothetical protein
MANIVETSVFDAGVYKIETTDPVLGGVQTAIANKQAVSLANRTLYLKDRLDDAGVQLSRSYAGNMNSLVNSGFYFIASGASNKPSGVTTGYCLVINDSSTATLVQQLTDAATNTVWLRRITAGPTYNAWVKLRTEDTVTATPVGFENGWAEVSGFPITLYRDGKICVCQGRMSGGTSGLDGTSFGSPYAPSQTLVFAVPGGTVTVYASTCNIRFTGTPPGAGVDLNLTWRIP